MKIKIMEIKIMKIKIMKKHQEGGKNSAVLVFLILPGRKYVRLMRVKGL